MATLGENPKKHQHRLSAPKNLSQNVAFPNNPTSHQPFPPPVAKQHGLVDLKRFAIVWIDLGKPRADPFPSWWGILDQKKWAKSPNCPPQPTMCGLWVKNHPFFYPSDVYVAVVREVFFAIASLATAGWPKRRNPIVVMAIAENWDVDVKSVDMSKR